VIDNKNTGVVVDSQKEQGTVMAKFQVTGTVTFRFEGVE
jgi:hypothetical protein